MSALLKTDDNGFKIKNFNNVIVMFRSNNGNSFAYVYRCNIYFRPSVKSDKVFPITTDGRPGLVFNGIPDWVYEGELKFIKAGLRGSQKVFVLLNQGSISRVKS